jgi:hypothetical protein
MRGRHEATIRYVCTAGHSTYVTLAVPNDHEARLDAERARIAAWNRAHPRNGRRRQQPVTPAPRARRARKWPPERIEAFRAAWNRGESSAVIATRFGLGLQVVSKMAAWFRRQGYAFARCTRGRGTGRLVGWVRGGAA